MAVSTRVFGLVARNWLREMRGRMYLSPAYRWRYAGRSVEQLLLAPQDIRTTDPTIANEIFGGRFSLGGSVVVAGNNSPFSVLPPTPGWQRTLLGFGWLRHLRAADSDIARARARTLIDDWISVQGRYHGPSWEPEVTARRIIAWISHSPLILEGADRAHYRRFMRSLSRQISYLRRAAQCAPDGLPRLTCIIALNYAGLCIAKSDRLQRQAAAWLDEELSAQILPDGGHISRYPAAIVDLLLDLLPLRQTFTARHIPPPGSLISAIDRMMPMVRFFRHGDGSFGLFNGMSATAADMVATVLAYDDTFGKPIGNASHSGYQRLEADTTIVLLDAGPPPPPPVSGDAHAGCLSFEMSSRSERIIVNCGRPSMDNADWQRAARTTAAHSTISIEDTSSCVFSDNARLEEQVGRLILSGPRQVTVERDERDSEILLNATHDGYLPRFGVLHERMMSLSRNGGTLKGRDNFISRRSGSNPSFAVRFHLHPDVKAATVNNGQALLLTLPSEEIWAFTAEGADITLEESVFLAGPHGAKPTNQIVLYGRTGHQKSVAWVIHRVGERKSGAADSEQTR